VRIRAVAASWAVVLLCLLAPVGAAARSQVAGGAGWSGGATVPAWAEAGGPPPAAGPAGGAGASTSSGMPSVLTPPPVALGVGGLPLLLGEPHHPTVPGTRARLVGPWAYAPTVAPPAVQAAVWAGNDLQASPYIYGGGHAGWIDRGYDCSGTVSYALHAGGLLDSPMASGDLESWGVQGRGRWITVYANAGHTFMVIAGLRLDTARYTTVVPAEPGPRWRMGPRPLSAFVVRHAAGL